MNHSYEIALALGILSPFISFWLLVLFGPRLGKPLAGWTGVVLGMGVPLGCAAYVLLNWLGESEAARATLSANAFRYHWADLGTVPVTVGVKLDSLTVAMYFMVAFIAFWIFVFSVGYMAGHSDEVAHQSKYHRFFAYLSLFGFSMLGLVASSSLLFLFIFWELVGLCSYLLIGYYFHERVPQYAQMKAFITNRVGDFGFLIGLMLVYFQLKTLDLDQAASIFSDQFATHTGIFASTYKLFGWSLATIMGVGLFCGAMGKSAQFPLHVWLPDAMAGPTPVSALIHAATMVAAGVYLVARVFRLLTPEAMLFIATIGCITLFLMALIAIVQTDIKKCLAYSTLSQLGYMIFGMGCGAWIAALFHLITHAFFKAMLFLGSGQVIEGCHHEQDMRKMGGLIRKMPVTGLTFLVGVLAIAGTGIPGTQIGLGGFFSKDEILAVAWTRAFDWEDPARHEAHHGEGHHAATESQISNYKLQDDHSEAGPVAGAPGSDPRIVLASHQPEPEKEELIVIPREAPAAALGWEYIRNVDPKYRVQGHLLGSSELAPPGEGGGRAESSLHDEHAGAAEPEIRLASDPAHAREHDGEHVAESGHDGHGSVAAIFHAMPKLPPWMFYVALFTAYVTPFYMMRCWWITFMGKPRDHHVHDHAHESPLMFIPLVVLAGGTFVSSYFLFRPLISDAAGLATHAPMVLAVDGHLHTPAIAAAHGWLKTGVGFAFLAGFVAAIMVYAGGLGVADRIRRVLYPLHTLLDRKYFIDELYDFVWVKGCMLVAKMARAVDTYLIDLIVDTIAVGTERLAAFSGLVIDAHGVDGVINGVAKSSYDLAGVIRSPQTGRIRNYVLFAAGVATILIAGVLVAEWMRTSG